MKKKIIFVFITPIVLYLILLIPTENAVDPYVANKKQFVWNRDSIWLALERKFVASKNAGCTKLKDSIQTSIRAINNLIDEIDEKSPDPSNKIYGVLEHKIFNAAALIGGCPDYTSDFQSLYNRLRNVIKEKSIDWTNNNQNARQTLYKIIYGGRAALEELLLQVNKNSIPSLSVNSECKSTTPGANILGVEIHSGDILVSRGGAPTSALIARGSDYPGNFSHIALVYVDESTNLPYIIESHIERGVVISSIYDYLGDKKLRVMVLRLRNTLPQIKADPLLPHKAAKNIYEKVKRFHIPYDFEMNCSDTTKLCCSEVASSAYNKEGIVLWNIVSSVSSPGTAQWLAGFGVKYFEFQEPSDLEYDSQLEVVAEWRNREALYQDHIDNAVVDAMIDWANEGNKLSYDWYMLPFARGTKLYSWFLNRFGKEGPIPEGMSPESGLRHKKFVSLHEQIKFAVEQNAKSFSVKYNYAAPYWKLVGFAKEFLLKIK